MTTNHPTERKVAGGGRHLTVVVLVLAGVVVALTVYTGLSKPKTQKLSPKEPRPTLAEDVLRRSDALMREGQYEQAGALMAAYLKQAADDVQVRTLLAQALLRLNRAADAEKEIDEVLKRSPRMTEALWWKGELVALRGGEDFLDYFRQAAQSPDATPEVWARYGLRMLSSGEDIAAEEYLRKAFEKGVKDVRLYRALGGLAYQANRFREAVELLAEATKRQPADARLWGMLASAQKNLGESDAAVRSLEEGLKVARGSEKPRLLMELGDARLQQGKPEALAAAAQAFADAAAYPEVAPDAALRAARCFYLIDRYASAMQYIDLAADLRPNDREVRDWQKKIEDARFGSAGATSAPAFRLPAGYQEPNAAGPRP